MDKTTDRITIDEEDYKVKDSDLGITVDSNCECKLIDSWESGFIYCTAQSKGSVQPNSNYRCVTIECSPGEKFTLNITASATAGKYSFWKSDGTKVEQDTTAGTLTNYVVTAPQNAAFLTINDSDKTKYSYIGVPLVQRVVENESDISELKSTVQKNNSVVKTVSAQSISANGKIQLQRTDGMTDAMNYYTLSGLCNVSNFEQMTFGLVIGDFLYASSYIVIKPSTVEVMFATPTPYAEETYNHGLTIDKYLEITITVAADPTVAKLVISSNGNTFAHDIAWRGSCGRAILENNGGTVTNAKLTYHCYGFNKKVWAFGDSYFNHYAPVLGELGYTDVMMDAMSGRNSATALSSLQKALVYHTPEVIFWAMGMNDKDQESAANASWQSCLDNVIAICTEKNIELILATIPNVSNTGYKNNYKNEVVRASGYKYADLNHAVGADISNSWYNGLLGSDNIHPTEKGSYVLVQEIVSVIPYIYKY